MRFLYVNSGLEQIQLRSSPPTDSDMSLWEDAELEILDLSDPDRILVLAKVGSRNAWIPILVNGYVSSQISTPLQNLDLDLWDERANAVEAEDDECQTIRRYLADAVSILRVLLNTPE